MRIWPFHKVAESLEAKDIGLADPALLSLLGAPLTSAGVAVGEAAVMQDATASAAIKLLTGIAQTTPLHFYQRGEGSDRERAQSHPADRLVSVRPDASAT